MATVFIGFPSGALPDRSSPCRHPNATASSDCSRISGLSCGALTLRAMMEVARGEPIVTAASAAIGLSRLSLAPVRAGSPSVSCAAQPRVSFVGDAGQTAGTAAKSLPFRQTAHAIRANLLARATAALLWPRRRSTCNAHVRNRSVAGAVFDFA
jgi:hypothetical protein